MKPIVRQPRNGNARVCGPLAREEGELIVWWYGGIFKNQREASVPQVVVFFRKLDERGVPTSFVRRNVALTHLGLLRIGTIWEQGVCKAEAVFRTEQLDLSFTQDEWSFLSPYESTKDGSPSPIEPSSYPLYFSRDRNWLLNFPLPPDKNLLIPCLEFYVRSYGRSEEVTRVLATYLWEEAQRRLYAPFDQLARPGHWPIKLAKRMRNGDVVFLAHVHYDSYAQRAAKSIYAQIDTALGNGESFSFIKVAPWFQGQSTLKVSGLWINGGKTFLALRLRGASEPQGQPIQRDRENPDKVKGPAVDADARKAWDGAPNRVLIKHPNIVDLTDADPPDHGAPTVEVEEDDFEVLGPRRVVIDVWRERAKTSVGKPGEDCEPEAFSTGEHHGTGKGVGYASIHARPVVDSHGMLRDMWDAMCHLKDSRPELIKSVEWFRPESGFSNSPEPMLVALRPFDEKGESHISTEIRNWVYYDPAQKTPRGVLVARMMAAGKLVYVVEIERRARRKKARDGSFTDSEESFMGLVALLEDELLFDSWLQRMLSDIRYVKGVVEKIVGGCPWKAAAFKHSRAGVDEAPCEAAVFNALAKVGIEGAKSRKPADFKDQPQQPMRPGQRGMSEGAEPAAP